MTTGDSAATSLGTRLSAADAGYTGYVGEEFIPQRPDTLASLRQGLSSCGKWPLERDWHSCRTVSACREEGWRVRVRTDHLKRLLSPLLVIREGPREKEAQRIVEEGSRLLGLPLNQADLVGLRKSRLRKLRPAILLRMVGRAWHIDAQWYMRVFATQQCSSGPSAAAINKAREKRAA